MRVLAPLLLAAAACLPTGPHARDLGSDDSSLRRVALDLDAARELDQEGVRSFRDGRYVDAIRYFRAAYRLGGPPSELWNVARCRERMDDAEGASAAIEQYLAQRDLSPQDRAEAEREVAALRGRPSMLTVITSPPGAIVTIDAHTTAGPTPVTLEIRAGAHSIAVHRDGFVTETRPLEARFGRAVLVSLLLARGSSDAR
jgi:hypothetical protein